MMTSEQSASLRLGQIVIYDNPAKRDRSRGVVEAVTRGAVVVQFEDRAQPNAIAHTSREWLDFLTIETP